MPSSVMPTPRQAGTPAPAAVSAIGLRKAYGDKTVLDGIDLYIPAGSVFALLGPNGAGKTTTVQILSTLIAADGGQAQVAGHDVAAAPDRVRSAIGVTGQFAALDDLLTAEENLLLMADLLRLGKREGKARAGGVAGAVRHRGRRAQAGRDLLRRDAAPARHRHDAGRRSPAIFLDEPTTGLDPRSRRTMWEMVRALVGRHHRLPHHPVPGGGRPVGRPDRHARRRPDRRRGAPPTNSRHGSPAAMCGCGSPTPPRTSARRPSSPAPPGTRTTSPCAWPATAGSTRCAACSTGSTPPASGPPTSPVHTPDLDDVFLALTGNGTAAHPAPHEGDLAMSALTYAVHDLDDDAAAQPEARDPLPVRGVRQRPHADHDAAAVRVRLRRLDRRRHRRRPGRLPGVPDARHHRHGGGRRFDVDLDRGLLRHDRGHHQPLPHHEHHPLVVHDGACRRQRHPDDGVHGRGRGRRARRRLPVLGDPAGGGWPRPASSPPSPSP